MILTKVVFKSCRTCLTNHVGSMPLVINRLRWIYTHTPTHTDSHNTDKTTHTNFTNKRNFKKSGVHWPHASVHLV